MNAVPDPELRRLVDRMLDEGGLDDAGTERLRELVRDPDAMDWFLSVVQQEAFLREIIPGYFDTKAAPRPRLLRFPSLAAGLVAALVAGILLGTLWNKPVATKEAASAPRASAPASGAARLTALVGVRWKTTTAPDLLAGGASPARLAMEAGLAELTYANGVRVTIEGPCDYAVSGANAGRLAFGKLVARVPRGAEGFRVDYARGHIVDLGTEFAMDVADDGAAEVGVFEGKIELHHAGGETIPLFANQAVQTAAGTEAPQAVPLNRDKFIRQVPSRDFRWAGVAGKTVKFRADVSHLVWKAADYRILFKAFGGSKDEKTEVSDVKLLRNGKVVAVDAHSTRIAPGIRTPRDCLFGLDVAAKDFAPGRWILEATLTTAPGKAKPVGVVQFEEGLVSHATEADFIGDWTYTFMGHRYRREILPGGEVNLYRDGAPDAGGFRNARWFVVDGVLHIEAGNVSGLELHFLRDRDTLIFANLPYENAKRAAPDEKK